MVITNQITSATTNFNYLYEEEHMSAITSQYNDSVHLLEVKSDALRHAFNSWSTCNQPAPNHNTPTHQNSNHAQHTQHNPNPTQQTHKPYPTQQHTNPNPAQPAHQPPNPASSTTNHSRPLPPMGPCEP